MGTRLPLKIVYVVPYAPTRIRTRPFHLIRALAADGHAVTVATCWSNPDERRAVERLVTEGFRVVAEPLSALRSAWNCCRALPGRDPLQSRYSWRPRLARRLVRLIRDVPADVVHVEHLRGVRYGLAVSDAAPRTAARQPVLVWDSVDCISSLFRRAARESRARRARAAARFELPRTERYEPRVAVRFDRVLVTSEIDRRELLQLGTKQAPALAPERVEVVPNGVDLEYFSPSEDLRHPLALVVTGKMSYHANRTAVVRFVEDVMPAVWMRLPDARLWIVGKDPPDEVLKLGEPWPGRDDGRATGRVFVTGTVPDIRPFLRTAAVAVAPIQYGVGIQNKVLEALACATPVVATPQAVSALEVRSGHEVIVASNPAEFANAVVALLNDPERRASVGQAGRAFVERRHDWRVVATGLAGIYRDAAA